MKGGGRGLGFQVVKYLPWSALLQFSRTHVGSNIQSLYNRLAAAYDHFYEVLGFMSPKMRTLLQAYQKSYAYSYRPTQLDNYAKAFNPDTSPSISESYNDQDYTPAYAHLLVNPASEGERIG